MSDPDLVVGTRVVANLGLQGFAVVMGQFLFLVGLKMSSAVTASVWQPSQPIWTLLIAILMGRETANRYKVGGVLLAFLGCLFMVAQTSSDDGTGHAVPAWIPNLCFFGNCLGKSVQRPPHLFPPAGTHG